MRFEFSLRYGVLGVYKDRSTPTWRIYPLPFIRVTIQRRKL